jgi:hypothetical protein
LPTVSKAAGRVLEPSLLGGWELAAADEFDELVPFGMAQPDRVICFADPYLMCVDDDLGASAAFRTKARYNLFHAFTLLWFLPMQKVGLEAGSRSSAPANQNE